MLYFNYIRINDAALPLLLSLLLLWDDLTIVSIHLLTANVSYCNRNGMNAFRFHQTIVIRRKNKNDLFRMFSSQNNIKIFKTNKLKQRELMIKKLYEWNATTLRIWWSNLVPLQPSFHPFVLINLPIIHALHFYILFAHLLLLLLLLVIHFTNHLLHIMYIAVCLNSSSVFLFIYFSLFIKIT